MLTRNRIITLAVIIAAIAVMRLDYGIKKQPAAVMKNIAAISSAPVEQAPESGVQNENNSVPVLRVIDGDTIVAEVNGQPIHVRLIGINSPELNDKRQQVACFAQKAKEEAQKLLDGQNVRLEKDLTQGDYDKYNRLLAYVFIASGTNFDKLMIEEGYAYEYTYRLPYKYQKEFKSAQAEAKAAQRGLWSPEACN